MSESNLGLTTFGRKPNEFMEVPDIYKEQAVNAYIDGNGSPTASDSGTPEGELAEIASDISPEARAAVLKDPALKAELDRRNLTPQDYITEVKGMLPPTMKLSDIKGEYSLPKVAEGLGRIKRSIPRKGWNNMPVDAGIEALNSLDRYTGVAGGLDLVKSILCSDGKMGLSGFGDSLELDWAALIAYLKGLLKSMLGCNDKANPLTLLNNAVADAPEDLTKALKKDLIPIASKSGSPEFVNGLIDDLGDSLSPAEKKTTVQSVLQSYRLEPGTARGNYPDRANTLVEQLDKLDPEWDKKVSNGRTDSSLTNYGAASDDALKVLQYNDRTKFDAVMQQDIRYTPSKWTDLANDQYKYYSATA